MPVHEVILPKTGMNMEDVTLLDWIAKEGTEVAVGDPIFRMETEKVEIEVPADDAGWLHQTVAPSETPHSIGTTIGLVATTHDEYDALVAAEAAS